MICVSQLWVRGCFGDSVRVIEVKGLTKQYGDYTAVDDITFAAESGKVTGFLGPNGAGKSTTMRMMVGLTKPTKGSVTYGGLHYEQIPNPSMHIGVLLDASAQHAGRTGREILTIGAMTLGLPTKKVDELLEWVSLTPKESRRRLKNYSLGMRQRLGIAYALMGDPKVLILDEPANGLDPAGIHWMRGLLREYADEGGTVLLSSHLLHEVEQIADEMIVIGRGKIVAQGSKAELLNAAGTLVRSLDDTTLASALDRAGIVSHNSSTGGLRVDGETIDVGKVAAAEGIVLTELRPAGGAGLEELFLELTSDTQREGNVA